MDIKGICSVFREHKITACTLWSNHVIVYRTAIGLIR